MSLHHYKWLCVDLKTQGKKQWHNSGLYWWRHQVMVDSWHDVPVPVPVQGMIYSVDVYHFDHTSTEFILLRLHNVRCDPSQYGGSTDVDRLLSWQGLRKLFPSSEQKFWNWCFLTKWKWNDRNKINNINGNCSILEKYLHVLHVLYADKETKQL